jgi:hypothetical protein
MFPGKTSFNFAIPAAALFMPDIIAIPVATAHP